ncbi:MAG: hypothetical protein HY064_12875 [Bacteroidetes bacterium]|nr:hypothetical protein [Bacteroidota bacterium]
MRVPFLIFFFFLFSVADACDCDAVKVSDASVSQYDVIFVGKVVAVSGCDKSSKAKFLIEKLFHGKSYESTEIEFDCTSDCQMSFTPGEEWIIYADYKSYGKPEVKFCGLSRRKFENEKDDYVSASHGMNFIDELSFLEKKFGVQKFNVMNVQDQQHHELLHPSYTQQFWLLLISIASIGLFYFIVKKVLK